MSNAFNAQHGLIIVRAEVFGPTGSIVVRLALDTGATGTLANVGLLTSIGYDVSAASDRVQITTGNGVEYVPRIVVSRLRTLGQERATFPILSHTLPPSASIDGLLGLDFLRGHELYLDFRSGYLALS